MISGSNNNNYQVTTNRTVSPASTVQSQAQTTQTSQVAQTNPTSVQASSVSFLGPISDFFSQAWSSIKSFFGGLFHFSSASTGIGAQSLSTNTQQTPVASTPVASSAASSVTPEAPVAISSPQTASAAPLKITLPTATASTQTAQTPQSTQNSAPVASSNIANMLHQFSQTHSQPATTQTQTPTSTTQVVSAQTTTTALAITPSLQKAASDALPEVDRLMGQFAALKPALDLFQVKKPSADDILNYLVEAKVAITQISQGQQPSIHGTGLVDFGKQTFKFSNDALRIVMTAKGLAQLFNYKDANFQKYVGEAEKSLMDIRVFSDILSRSVQ